MVWGIVVLVVLSVASGGAKIVIEARREQRRERRYTAWQTMTTQLPPGSRLRALEPDGSTVVEIGVRPGSGRTHTRNSRGRR